MPLIVAATGELSGSWRAAGFLAPARPDKSVAAIPHCHTLLMRDSPC